MVRDKIIDVKQYVSAEQVEPHFRCPDCYLKCVDIVEPDRDSNMYDEMDEDASYMPIRRSYRASSNHSYRKPHVPQETLDMNKAISNPYGVGDDASFT